MNAKKVFSQSDREIIEQRIGEIERTTSAELVVAVATESGNYDRAESVVGILTALIALGVANLIQPLFYHTGDWGAPGLQAVFQGMAVVLGYMAGNYLAAFCFPIRRLFSSKSDQINATKKSAAHVFYNHKLRETHSQCGVLIYLSLFERCIAILPDESCKEALGAEKIQEICDSAIAELKIGNYRQAILQVLEQLSITLSDARPADRDLDKNELSNHLLTFHRSV